MRSWRSREAALGAGTEPTTREFLLSSAGLRALHRIVLAALLVFCLSAGAGVGTVKRFLVLSGLAPFMACSESTLTRSLRALIDRTGQWADQERPRMAASMPPRRISLAPDETVRSKQMLVAIDLASNFLVVEKISASRSATTWADAVEEGLRGMPVVVEQITADEAPGLRKLADELLGAHKSSDLMHGQQEIHRATAAPMAAQVRAAEKTFAKAAEHLNDERRKASAWSRSVHGPGRPPDWPARIENARAAVRAAGQALERVIEQQVGLRLCVRDLGQALHPVSVETGRVVSAQGVHAALEGIFSEIWQRVIECGLGTSRWDMIAKAKRLVPSWVGSLAWWHRRAEAELDAENLTQPLRTLMWEVLIPTRYLERVRRQTVCGATRARLAALIERVSEPLRCAKGVWLGESLSARRRLDALAQQIVNRWQRASSTTEGRNGYLELHHHHLRGLRPARLKALTVVHNFLARREDGTTAAERFFGAPHADLFEHLVAVMPMPALPRVRRKKPKPVIVPLAA